MFYRSQSQTRTAVRDQSETKAWAFIWQTNKIRKATETAQNRKEYGKTNSEECKLLGYIF